MGADSPAPEQAGRHVEGPICECWATTVRLCWPSTTWLRVELACRLDVALEGCDALLTPTVPSPPPSREPEWDDDDFFGDMVWTVPANLTGHPAVSLPVHGSAEPVGLQLIGRRGADDALLALAEARRGSST